MKNLGNILLLLCFLNSISVFSQRGSESGLLLAKSNFGFDESKGRLKHLLKTSPDFELIAEIDHAQNAAKNSLQLSPLTTFLLRIPEAEIKLMQQQQLAGLDLPLRISLYQDENEEVFMVASNPDFLGARYNLGRQKELRKMKNLLHKKIEKASGAKISNSGKLKVKENEGVILKKSPHDFNTTYALLLKEIESIEKLGLFAEIDHCDNASQLQMGLRPATLVIFGNPDVGSVLMQNNPQIGLELPVRILVWRDDAGQVFLSYNDPSWLAQRFGLDKNLSQIEMMSKVLEKISKKVTGEKDDEVIASKPN